MRATGMWLALLLAAQPVGAQDSRSAAARLQEAVHQEVVAGDLERAIQLYQGIVTRPGGDRAAAAQALAYLGRTYEKLGRREAQAVYERVVREYGDQAEPVQYARARLQALRPEGRTVVARADAGTPVSTMVMGNLPPLRERDAPQFDFAPSGDRVVFVRGTDGRPGRRLYVTDDRGAVVRPLFETHEPGRHISPRWSPDGRWIAYSTQYLVGSEQLARVVVVPAEGGPPRTVADSIRLLRPATGGIFWTPDSRGITFANNNSVRTVNLDGATRHTVAFESRYLTQLTGYSPDGRWMAFHEVNRGTESDREMDVWILPAEGGRAIQLTDAPGFDGWPAWAPDGRSVYFVSERSGSSNVWQVDVDPQSGLPRGDARQVTHYGDADVMHPKALASGQRLAYALVRRTNRVHVAPVDRPSEARVVARGTHPQLSPDGQTVYFVGQGTDQRGLFAVPAAGGEPRRLTLQAPVRTYYPPFALSTRGDAISYFAPDGAHRILHTVPTTGGVPRELLRLESGEALVPSWAPDGSRLAYSHGNGLFTIPAAGGEPVKLAHLYSWDGWTVRWSPDGRHIAALGWTRPGSQTDQNVAVLVPADGGELRHLSPEQGSGYKEALEWRPDSRGVTYMDYGPDWQEDGSRIAWLDGQPVSPVGVQPPPQWDYVGRFAPDGHRFFFISAGMRANAWGLFVHDMRTGVTSVAWPDTDANPGTQSLTGFSADGRLMTWSVSDDLRQLWLMEWPATTVANPGR
jgi:Tol biopolymer transport system component